MLHSVILSPSVFEGFMVFVTPASALLEFATVTWGYTRCLCTLYLARDLTLWLTVYFSFSTPFSQSYFLQLWVILSSLSQGELWMWSLAFSLCRTPSSTSNVQPLCWSHTVWRCSGPLQASWSLSLLCQLPPDTNVHVSAQQVVGCYHT